MLVGDSLVSGEVIRSELDLDLLEYDNELVVDDSEDQDEDEDKDEEETNNWVAKLRDVTNSDEEIGLVTSIYFSIALETLLPSELIMKLK